MLNTLIEMLEANIGKSVAIYSAYADSEGNGSGCGDCGKLGDSLCAGNRDFFIECNNETPDWTNRYYFKTEDIKLAEYADNDGILCLYFGTHRSEDSGFVALPA
jgi:hypothetical protein